MNLNIKGKRPLYFGILFLTLVGFFAYLELAQTLVFFHYALVSILTLITYAIDKSKAKKGKWRIPESTLHILSLIGGWPGALIGQKIFRHKTKKQAFRFFFWLTVIINLNVLIWIHTSQGANHLEKWASLFYSYVKH